MKIDAVYTWVDGNDKKWQRKKERTLAGYKGYPTKNGLVPGRFINREELRFSLRSINQYAPWINHIYLVTDQQIPTWLNLSHPKITIVDHAQIFPPCVVRPTFNSLVIETYLHRIPHLSEYAIYFNDDVMLNRPVTPADFFTGEGKPISLVDDLPSTPPDIHLHDKHLLPLTAKTAQIICDIFARQPNLQRDQWLSSYLNAYSLAQLSTNKKLPLLSFRHSPHPFRKSQLTKVYRQYQSFFDLTARHQFRDQTDAGIFLLTVFRGVIDGLAQISREPETVLEYTFYPNNWCIQSPVEYAKMLFGQEKFLTLGDGDCPAQPEYEQTALMALRAKFFPCDFENDGDKQLKLQQRNCEQIVPWLVTCLAMCIQQKQQLSDELGVYRHGKLHRLAEMVYTILGKSHQGD